MEIHKAQKEASEWGRERSVTPGSGGAPSAVQFNIKRMPPCEDECDCNIFSDWSLSTGGLCSGAFYVCV